MPWRPMAFSIPDGVSRMRGGACRSRSDRKGPFTATPPSVERSTTSPYSTPYPKQPLAAMSGLASVSEPSGTERSMLMRQRFPDDAAGVEDRAVDAGAHMVRGFASDARQHDAAVAAAETAA